MLRAPLRLLLILTLVANAVAAPSARGAMTHAHRHADASAGVAAAHGHAHHAAVDGPIVAASPMTAHHDHAAMAHASLEASSSPDDPGSCCDSDHCSCGCMLPPMLSVAAQAPIASAWMAPPPRGFAALSTSTRHRPPLRPPAG